MFTGCEAFFRPLYVANLVSSWIPALDGVDAKLRAGGRVADVGCGLGASTVLLAQAYPAATIVGSDYHQESIEIARTRAATAGVADGISFEASSAQTFTGSGYDLVATFDCLHDMGDPLGAARHIREALAPDGAWLIVEPYAGDTVLDNLNPLGRMSYSFSSFLCVPNGLSQPGGYSLGAQAGERRIRQVVTDAGFARFRRAAETPFNLDLRGPTVAASTGPQAEEPASCGAQALLDSSCNSTTRRPPHEQRCGRAAVRIQLGDKRCSSCVHQLRYPDLQRVDVRLELDDPLDAGQVDALVLREPLHLAQQRDVARRVAPPAAAGPARASPGRAGRTGAGSARASRPAAAATEMTKTGASSGTSLGRRRSAMSASRSRAAPRARGDLRARVVRLRRGELLAAPPRASPVSVCGTATSTVTSRSPVRPPCVGTPRPRTRSVRPDGVPGGTLSADRAVQRRHPQRRAQRRLGEADRHGQRQVVTVAAEQLVRADMHGHVQVAGRPTARPGLALAGNRSFAPSSHPGRHPHGDRAGLGRRAGAVALRARARR